MTRDDDLIANGHPGQAAPTPTHPGAQSGNGASAKTAWPHRPDHRARYE